MNLTVAELYLVLHGFGYTWWCWHRAPHGSSPALFRKQVKGQQVLIAQALTVPQPKQYAERQYVTVYLEGNCGGDYNCGHFHLNPLGLWSFAWATLGKAKMIERTTNVEQKNAEQNRLQITNLYWCFSTGYFLSPFSFLLVFGRS